ncbi:MAG: hypothetical protein ACREPZ_14645 [Rhodanobacteraceae bacterium]
MTMFTLPIIIAALALGGTTYPEGFVAHCSHGQEASVPVTPDQQPHLRQQNDSAYRVDIRRQDGQFVVWSLGLDYQVGAANGKEWKLSVLKQKPGDLVLSVETSTYGASISVYHLRFEGAKGMLTITKTSYYGYGSDSSSLTSMTCNIDGADTGQ